MYSGYDMTAIFYALAKTVGYALTGERRGKTLAMHLASCSNDQHQNL